MEKLPVTFRKDNNTTSTKTNIQSIHTNTQKGTQELRWLTFHVVFYLHPPFFCFVFNRFFAHHENSIFPLGTPRCLMPWRSAVLMPGTCSVSWTYRKERCNPDNFGDRFMGNFWRIPASILPAMAGFLGIFIKSVRKIPARWFKPWPNLIPYFGGHRCNHRCNHFKGHVFTHHPRWRFSPFVGCHIFKGCFSVPIKAIFIKVSWKIHVGHAMTGPTKSSGPGNSGDLFLGGLKWLYLHLSKKCSRFWRSLDRYHLKMDGWKTIFLLGWLPCGCYITFVCLRWFFTFYNGKSPFFTTIRENIFKFSNHQTSKSKVKWLTNADGST